MEPSVVVHNVAPPNRFTIPAEATPRRPRRARGTRRAASHATRTRTRSATPDPWVPLAFRLLLPLALCLVLLSGFGSDAQAASVVASSSAGNGGATTLDLAMPTGTTQYDVMVATLTLKGGTGAVVSGVPSGWTQILRTDNGVTISQVSYYKVAGASEAGPYQWTFATSIKASGGIITLRGIDNAGPVDVSGGQADLVGSTSVVAPSVTTTVANTILVGGFGHDRVTTLTVPGTMTGQFDVGSTGGGPTTRTETAAGTEAKATAGSTGTRTATAADSDQNIGQLIAFKPPSVAFTSSSSSGAESTTSVNLAVTLSGASSQTTTVDYAVTGGTATGGGTDYTLATGTLTFNAGVTSQNIPVTVVDDSADESSETVIVTLSNPSGANLGTNTAHTYTITDNDSPTVTVTASDSSASETGPDTGAFTFTRTTGDTSGSLTVPYTITGTATSASDYVALTNPAVILTGQASVTITVTPIDDATGESSETVIATINSDAAYVVGSPSSATINIADNDATLVSVTASDADAAEPGTDTGQFTITRTGDTSGSLSVNFAVTGTATSGTDYTSIGTSTTISAGSATKTITVTALDDALDEASETVILTLSSGAGYTVDTPSAATVNIADDDAAPTVTLAVDSSSLTEAPQTATITATLSAASGQDVTVNLAYSGTATLTSDYTRSGTQIVISAGATTGTATVTTVQDTVYEGAETIIVDISSVTNGAESGTQQVTVTITEDDAAPTVTLSLTGDPMAEAAGAATVTATLSASAGVDVTVNLAFSGTATLTDDYTRSGTQIVITAGATTGTVTLTAVQDALDEAAETIIVDISSVTNGAESGAQQVTATITDDDAAPTVTLSVTGTPMAEAAGAATVTATLSAASGQTVTVDLSFSGTAILTDDYTRSGTQIIIGAGSTTGTITLTAVQDTLDEATETVIVDISSVTNGAESGTQQVTASITDDDAAPTVTLSLSGSPLAENGGAATVTATLSAASGQTVTVDLSFSGTATLTDDYTRSGTQIVVSAGATTGTITLTGVDDALDEAAETIIVDISAVANGAESGTQQVTASITDDDAAPTVTLSLSGSPLAENGGAATVTATLSAASGQTVTVDLSFSGTATLTDDYTRSGTQIVISAGATTGTATITGVDDALDEAAETIIVDISAVTNGAESGTQQVTASITDDDATPTVTLSLTGSPMAEAAGAATVTATLSAASGQDVTVDLSFSGTATLTDDYTRSGTQIVISAGSTTGTVTLTAVQDALDEAAETIVVDISGVTNGAESGTQQVTASITDDDAAPTVTLSLSGSPLAEAAGAATVTATLSAASGQTVTVDLAFSGTATLTDDYTRSGTQIVISAGSTTGTVTLTAVQDTLDEAGETIVVDISGVTNGAESGTQQVTATITDDDAAPTVTLSLTGSPMAEAAGSATVTATLSAASGQTVTVDLSFSGSATLTDDYTRSGTQIVISAGATTGTVTLTAVQDTLDEAAETIVVDISGVTNGAESGTQQVTASITDDDAAPTVTLSLSGSPLAENGGVATVTATLSGASGQTVTVDLTFAGTATLTDDYTRSGTQIVIAAGATTGTITLTGVDDAFDEAAETIIVDISAVANGAESGTQQVTASITDDDAAPTVTLSLSGSPLAENGGAATVTATLSAASGQTVTVDLAFSGTATLTDDYTHSGTQIVISAGATTGTITLTGVDDALDEATETIIVDISAVTNGAESGTQQVTASITDDDAAPTVTLSLTGSPIAEAAGSATVTATLSAVSGQTVTVDLGFSGTATLTDDYTRSDTQIVIAAGATTGSITLTAVQDTLDEAAETIIVDISAVANGAESGTQQVTASITDDDAAPTVTLSIAGASMAEDAGTATVTATLSAASGQTVTVDLEFTGTATLTDDYTRTGAQIVISAGATTGTVTLTAVQDALNEADETIIVDISAVANGAESGTQQVTATILDDEGLPTVTLSLAGSPLAEDGGAATVTATLSAASGQDVTVTLAFSGTATLTDDYTRSGTQIVITAGATTGSVTLTGVNDALDEAAETIIVDISGVTNAAESGTQQVTASITDDDAAPTVTLAVTGSPMAEAAGSATVTATLSAASGQTVTVDLSFGGTATLTDDYTRSGTQIVIAAGSTTGSITLTAVQDTVDEASETIIVDINGVTNGAESGTQQVTASITDDDAAPTVTLSLSGSPLAEAAGTATVTATLSAASGQDFTVDLAFSGTATLTSDYTRSGTQIIIPAGSTTGTVTLTAVQDDLDEITETIVVDIDAVTNGAEPGTQQVTASITDDDAAPTVTLGISGSPLAENGGVATITATLSAASGQTVTVDLSFTGTATFTSDYTRSGTQIVISPGSTTGTVTVTGADDALDEAAETVVVDISAVTNGAESGTQQVTATITDDDAAPTVTLSLSGSPLAENGGAATVTATLSAASGQDITVDLAFSGTATPTDDYTRSGTQIVIAAGSTTGTVTITGVDDALFESAETVIVDISAVTNGAESGTQQVTATITDDEGLPTVTLAVAGSPLAENGGVATITATLSAASGQDVTVSLGFSGTAALTSDYTRSGTQIVITAGSTTGSITLTGVDDALDEAAETIIVDVTTVTNAAESGTQQVTATITDDDAAPTVTLSLAGSPMAEAAGAATVTATLSAASGQDVAIDLAFTGTATLTDDYARSGTQIVISAGATTGSITLTAVQDTIDEAAETIIVDISTVTNGAESGSQQVTASITDDDAPTVTVAASDASASETGLGTGSFLVTRTSGDTSADLVVLYTVSGTAGAGADYTALSGSVTIPAGSTTATILATPIDDTSAEAAETVILTLATDAAYVVGTPSSATVTIADNDAAGITVTPQSGLTTTEAGGTATFTVVLNTQPSADVVIGLTSSNTAEGTVAPSSLTFTSANWNTAQTVTVTGVDDALDDGDVAYQITTAAATSSDGDYNGINAADVSVTNTDNDGGAVAGFTLAASGGSTTVTEAGATDSFTVVLDAAPSSDVVLSVASGDIGEATVSPATMTFTSSNWNTPQTVIVTGVDDLSVDGAQTFTITLSILDAQSDDAYDAVADQSLTGTTTDDDVAGSVQWEAPVVALTAQVASTFTVPPVGDTSPFNLTEVAIIVSNTGTSGRVQVQPLAALPANVPASPSQSALAQIWEMRFEAADDSALTFSTATQRFALSNAWLTANCPPASCNVVAFHYDVDHWVQLTTRVLTTTASGRTYEFDTTSFSPFAIGGLNTGGGGGGGGGSPGGGYPTPPPEPEPPAPEPEPEPPTEPPVPEPPLVPLPPAPQPVISPVIEASPGLDWLVLVGLAALVTVGSGVAFRYGAHHQAARLARAMGRGARRGAYASADALARAAKQARRALARAQRPVPQIPLPHLKFDEPVEAIIRQDAQRLDRVLLAHRSTQARGNRAAEDLRAGALNDLIDLNKRFAAAHRQIASRAETPPDAPRPVPPAIVREEARHLDRLFRAHRRALDEALRAANPLRDQALADARILSRMFHGIHGQMSSVQRRGQDVPSHALPEQRVYIGTYRDVETEALTAARAASLLMADAQQARREGQAEPAHSEEETFGHVYALNQLLLGLRSARAARTRELHHAPSPKDEATKDSVVVVPLPEKRPTRDARDDQPSRRTSWPYLRKGAAVGSRQLQTPPSVDAPREAPDPLLKKKRKHLPPTRPAKQKKMRRAPGPPPARGSSAPTKARKRARPTRPQRTPNSFEPTPRPPEPPSSPLKRGRPLTRAPSSPIGSTRPSGKPTSRETWPSTRPTKITQKPPGTPPATGSSKRTASSPKPSTPPRNRLAAVPSKTSPTPPARTNESPARDDPLADPWAAFDVVTPRGQGSVAVVHGGDPKKRRKGTPKAKP